MGVGWTSRTTTMNVRGNDGRRYVWHLPGVVRREDCSLPHRRARLLLLGLFPADVLLEEVFLPGSCKLRLDFYLPRRRMGVEVQGGQHEEYNSFFHKDRDGFGRSLWRDQGKRLWCEQNGILLCELPANEPDDRWRARLWQGLQG